MKENTEKNIVSFFNDQLLILRDMQKAGYNIVTCWDCGNVIMHRKGEIKKKCECGQVVEMHDCPDLYY